MGPVLPPKIGIEVSFKDEKTRWKTFILRNLQGRGLTRQNIGYHVDDQSSGDAGWLALIFKHL